MDNSWFNITGGFDEVTSEYRVKYFKATKQNQDEVCFLCGKYFKEGEEIILFVPHDKYRDTIINGRRNLAHNLRLHKKEYDKWKSWTPVQIITFLLEYTPRRKTNMITKEQAKLAEVFKRAAATQGFKRVSVTKDGNLHIRKETNSDAVWFNPRTEQITSNTRKKFCNTLEKDKLDREYKMVCMAYNEILRIERNNTVH